MSGYTPARKGVATEKSSGIKGSGARSLIRKSIDLSMYFVIYYSYFCGYIAVWHVRGFINILLLVRDQEWMLLLNWLRLFVLDKRVS